MVVSRQALIDSGFSTVICAPVYSRRDGFATQIDVGPENGLKHESSILCDALVSMVKSGLTDYLSTLPPEKVAELDEALRVALALA